MKTSVIIQARMGSSRLPGKMLMLLAGEPVIAWVYKRASMIDDVDSVVVATTTDASDNKLVDYCRSSGMGVFRGDVNDVLDRMYKAAKHENADVVVRVTGDCPLLDPRQSSRVVAELLRGDCDYACNVAPPTFPDGLDTEAMTMGAIERVWREAESRPDREHVTLFIRNNPSKFNIANVVNEKDLNALRWTLDELKDYRLLESISGRLKEQGKFGYMDEVLGILEREPELGRINSEIERNEGLKKSLLDSASGQNMEASHG